MNCRLGRSLSVHDRDEPNHVACETSGATIWLHISHASEHTLPAVCTGKWTDRRLKWSASLSRCRRLFLLIAGLNRKAGPCVIAKKQEQSIQREKRKAEGLLAALVVKNKMLAGRAGAHWKLHCTNRSGLCTNRHSSGVKLLTCACKAVCATT